MDTFGLTTMALYLVIPWCERGSVFRRLQKLEAVKFGFSVNQIKYFKITWKKTREKQRYGQEGKKVKRKPAFRL